MDLAKVLQELHQELENLDNAIASLERLEEAGKHRSQTPEWLDEIKTPANGRRRKSASASK